MPLSTKKRADAFELLPAVLKNNQLDMAAVVGIIFGELAQELRGKILDAADKDGLIASGADVLAWFEKAWKRSLEAYKQALFQKMYFAARCPYEAEAVLFSHYFKTDTLERAEKDPFVKSFGVKVGPVFDDYIERQARKNVEAAVARVYNDGLNLSSRLWKLEKRSFEQVQSTLMMGVVEKKSAVHIAKEIEKHLHPDAQWTRWGYSRLNKMTPADRAKDFTGLLRKPNPMPFDRTPPTRGISYNALRLARHEINTMGVNASLDSLESAPWTEGMRWNLSPAHNVWDICDSLASGGDIGGGVYSVGNLPTMPAHVQCFCFPTGELLKRDAFIGKLRGWLHGTDSWPEMDTYALRIQGSPGHGALKRYAQAALSNASKATAGKPTTKNPSAQRVGADAAMEKALTHGLTTNTEILIAVDVKTGAELTFQSGSANAVAPSDEFLRILKEAKKQSVVLVHNHPSSSAFSVEDINFFGKFESIKRMEVIGHDGTKYFLSKQSGYTYDKVAIFVDHKMAVDEHFPKYAEKVMAGQMTDAQAWKEHSHEALKDFVKLHMMRYKRVIPE